MEINEETMKRVFANTEDFISASNGVGDILKIFITELQDKIVSKGNEVKSDEIVNAMHKIMFANVKYLMKQVAECRQFEDTMAYQTLILTTLNIFERGFENYQKDLPETLPHVLFNEATTELNKLVAFNEMIQKTAADVFNKA